MARTGKVFEEWKQYRLAVLRNPAAFFKEGIHTLNIAITFNYWLSMVVQEVSMQFFWGTLFVPVRCTQLF